MTDFTARSFTSFKDDDPAKCHSEQSEESFF
jgi:hypothetical protein